MLEASLFLPCRATCAFDESPASLGLAASLFCEAVQSIQGRSQPNDKQSLSSASLGRFCEVRESSRCRPILKSFAVITQSYRPNGLGASAARDAIITVGYYRPDKHYWTLHRARCLIDMKRVWVPSSKCIQRTLWRDARGNDGGSFLSDLRND
jgi:hypothetical protein